MHVEPLRQSTPHAATSQVTRQVEALHETVLDSPVTTTSQVALSRQLTLAERPTVKSHVEPTHSGLALSPATTSQLAPPVQSALHELPQVAAHEAALQSRLQLEPSPLQLETFVQPQLIEEEPAHAHAAPMHSHCAAGQGTGPGAEPHATTSQAASAQRPEVTGRSESMK